MSLTVVSCCTYLTDAAEVAWRPVDYDAHDFVMAVKGRSINGYAYVPCGGTIHRIEDSNRDMALDLFARAVAAHVLDYGLDRPIALVPVPNSRADVRATTAAPRTLEQAQALARHLGPHARVADVLRWRSRMLSARALEGPRDPQSLFDELLLVGDLPRRVHGAIAAPTRHTVVLVDDVMTSGGHLQAAAAVLRAAETCEIACAVVAGRSDKTQVNNPFAVRVEALPDFTPQDSEEATVKGVVFDFDF